VQGDIYKIGYTANIEHRIRAYPKPYSIVSLVRVGNGRGFQAEKQALVSFKNQFTWKRREYGNEYFEGSVANMMFTIMSVAMRFQEDIEQNGTTDQVVEYNNAGENTAREGSTVLEGATFGVNGQFDDYDDDDDLDEGTTNDENGQDDKHDDLASADDDTILEGTYDDTAIEGTTSPVDELAVTVVATDEATTTSSNKRKCPLPKRDAMHVVLEYAGQIIGDRAIVPIAEFYKDVEFACSTSGFQTPRLEAISRHTQKLFGGKIVKTDFVFKRIHTRIVSDSISRFFKNMVVETGCTKDKMTLKAAYDAYCKHLNKKDKAEQKRDFKNELIAAIGQFAGKSNGWSNFWKGFRIKNNVSTGSNE
jgi:hypothetical protein